jgi:hypothetical protein
MLGFAANVDSDFISMIAAVFTFGQISTHSPQRVQASSMRSASLLSPRDRHT